MKQSIRILAAGAAIAATFALTTGSAMAWDQTSYPGQDQLMTSTPLTTVFYAGATPVASVTSDMDNDVTLDPGPGNNTGSVDTATFSNTTGSSGLDTVVTSDALPWAITNDPSGAPGVVIDPSFIVHVKSGGSIVGSATATGSVTGTYNNATCALTFSNASGLTITSASGALAGLNGLPGKLSGVVSSTASPCPQLD